MRLILSLVLLLSLTACKEDGQEKEDKYRKLAEQQRSILISNNTAEGCVALAKIREPSEVLGVCIKEAEKGSRTAKAILGDLYAKSSQWNEAMYWYEVAAKESCAYSQYQLAKAYLTPSNAPAHYRAALHWLLASAKAGYSPSQLLLAKIYHEGKWVEKNEYVAFQWYNECVKEQPEAAFQVGVAYLTGELGQKQNIEQGILYINHAAVQQYQPAVTVLHNLEAEGKKMHLKGTASIQYFRDEALKGSAEAQVNLAKMLMQYSIPQYDKAALYWVTQSAKQGNIDAKFLLAQFYYGGIGTEVNYARAFALFNELVRQQHTEAKFWLGKMYTEGQGVGKDEYLGKKWIIEAAEDGVQEAKIMVEIWSNAQAEQAMLEQDFSNDNANEPISADDLNEGEHEKYHRIY